MDPDNGSHSPQGDPTMADHNLKYQRSLRSLNVLTVKFVRLLQESENGELDLKDAVRILAVGQKRRIYDITNVLEGVGLIVKLSKSMIKWKGANQGENVHDISKRVIKFKSELDDLEQKEQMLDQQTFWIKQSIRDMAEDCSNLTYVNHEDICNCFSGHTLLAVRAPSGTQLDVPIPKAVQNSPAKYQIHLKSVNGPIDVVLLNKRSISSAPVVLPVPPPEHILRSAKSAMIASHEAESSILSCQASDPGKHSTGSRKRALEDIHHLHSSPFIKTEPNRTGGLRNLSQQLEEILKPTKAMMNADIIKELLSSNIFSSLLRIPPATTDHHYTCNLEESDGLCDAFDIPLFKV